MTEILIGTSESGSPCILRAVTVTSDSALASREAGIVWERLGEPDIFDS